jgi:hypothetical protein
VGGVVDERHHEAERQVEGGHGQDLPHHGAPRRRIEPPALADGEAEQHAEQGEESGRRAQRGLGDEGGAGREAERAAEQEDEQEAHAPVQPLDGGPDGVERVPVHADVHEPAVQEARREEPPPLARPDARVDLGEALHQLGPGGGGEERQHQRGEERARRGRAAEPVQASPAGRG